MDYFGDLKRGVNGSIRGCEDELLVCHRMNNEMQCSWQGAHASEKVGLALCSFTDSVMMYGFCFVENEKSNDG